MFDIWCAMYLFVTVVDDSPAEEGFAACAAQAAEMITASDVAANSADFRRFRDRGMTNVISATCRRRLSQIHPLILRLKCSLRAQPTAQLLSRLKNKKKSIKIKQFSFTWIGTFFFFFRVQTDPSAGHDFFLQYHCLLLHTRISSKKSREVAWRDTSWPPHWHGNEIYRQVKVLQTRPPHKTINSWSFFSLSHYLSCRSAVALLSHFVGLRLSKVAGWRPCPGRRSLTHRECIAWTNIEHKWIKATGNYFRFPPNRDGAKKW